MNPGLAARRPRFCSSIIPVSGEVIQCQIFCFNGVSQSETPPLRWPCQELLGIFKSEAKLPFGLGERLCSGERIHKILFTCDGRAGGRWRTKQITNLCLTVTEVLMFISWNLEMCDVIDIFKSQSDGTKRLINSTLKVELHQSMQYPQCGNGNISNGWKFPKAFLFFYFAADSTR